MSKRKTYSKEELMQKIRKLEKLVHYASESDTDSDGETRGPTDPEDPEDLREVIMIVEEENPENIQEGGGGAVSGEKHEDVSEEIREFEPLSELVINILGDDGPTQEEAQSCLPELAVRWENILKTGLKKESKDFIQSKYKALLSNCPSLTPPRLNIEIKAAVSETAAKRDFKIIEEQKQLATVITSLGLAMTSVIKENPNHIQVLEYLSDSARLLCHMHYEISKNRRNILASGLNKDVKDLMDNSLIEGLLFGNDFTDKIKASQAAKKLSLQSLKPTVPSKAPKDKPKHNLNYKGPLRLPAAARSSGQKGNFHRHQPKNSAHQQRPASKKHPPQRRP